MDIGQLEGVLSQFFDIAEVRKESVPELGSLKVKFTGLDGKIYTLRFVKFNGKYRLWKITSGVDYD